MKKDNNMQTLEVTSTKNFISRNPLRTEDDDFQVNVSDKIGLGQEALPIFEEGFIIGWRIVNKYE